MPNEACERDEFRTPCSPPGLEVIQLSSDAERDSSAFYLDCPSWTLDNKFLAFHRQPSEDGGKKAGFWLCDVENGFASHPVCEYPVHSPTGRDGDGSYGCVLSPAGAGVYHLARRSDRNGTKIRGF